MTAEHGEIALAMRQQERRRARITQQLGVASEWLAQPGVALTANDLWRVFVETHPELTTKSVDEDGVPVMQVPTLMDGLAAMDTVTRFGGYEMSLAEIAIDFCRRAKTDNS